MNIEIANRLLQLRKERGLSQEDLAERIGISRQSVSKWERAEASPDTDNLIALARLYGVSLDELLLGGEPNENEQNPRLCGVRVFRSGKRILPYSGPGASERRYAGCRGTRIHTAGQRPSDAGKPERAAGQKCMADVPLSGARMHRLSAAGFSVRLVASGLDPVSDGAALLFHSRHRGKQTLSQAFCLSGPHGRAFFGAWVHGLVACELAGISDRPAVLRIVPGPESSVRRVLKPGGGLFKLVFKRHLVLSGGGPEDGIPHVYVELDDRSGL